MVLYVLDLWIFIAVHALDGALGSAEGPLCRWLLGTWQPAAASGLLLVQSGASDANSVGSRIPGATDFTLGHLHGALAALHSLSDVSRFLLEHLGPLL